MKPDVVIIGAGLAGLAAGVECAGAGARVLMLEAAGHAGGRCRTYHDAHLDCAVDNGNHFLLSANHEARDYVRAIGAEDAFTGADRPARFDFLDVRDGRRWAVRPNGGPLPWWILKPDRRPPGAGLWDHIRAARIAFAKRGDRVGDLIDENDPLYETFWEPFTLAVLNTPVKEASAKLLARAILLTFGKGEGSCRTLVAREGLGPALVDPAVDFLEKRGAEIRFNARVADFERREDGGVRALRLAGEDPLAVQGDTPVILATSPAVAEALAPDVTTPDGAAPIANVHFRLDRRLAEPGEPTITAVIGGRAQWVVLRDDVASVTISAAFAVDKTPKETLVADAWRDVARVLGLGPDAPEPPARVVRERRATFLQTPDNEGRRPAPGRFKGNLHLAGDWTATDLPACIDGAVTSGRRAAREACRMAGLS